MKKGGIDQQTSYLAAMAVAQRTRDVREARQAAKWYCSRDYLLFVYLGPLVKGETDDCYYPRW